jgi:hypothetical protein
MKVERGKATVMASTAEEDNSDDQGANAENQLSLDDLVKPAQTSVGATRLRECWAQGSGSIRSG